MTRPTGHTSQHLSPDASSEIIRALRAYQEAYDLCDYDLAAILGVSRDTVGRWRRHPVGLPAKTIERLLAGIEEHTETTSAAHAALTRALTIAQQALIAAEGTPAERLRRRLNERGYRGNAVLAEIEAAGLQITSKKGP